MMKMAPIAQTSLRFLAHILVFAMTFRGGWTQFSPCPPNATSCCQCITVPGCSWYYGPSDESTERLPRCRPLGLVAERPISYSEHYLAPPGLVNIMDIPPRMNRPINSRRNRLLKPQTARLTVGLGMRRLVPIQVKAQTRRVRLKVIGPRDAPEFRLVKGDDLSCANRFRVRERTSQRSAGRTRGPENTRRSGTRNRPALTKQLIVDCYVAAPREIQNLNLVVDMNRCFAGKKIIRIMLRERGLKRTKVEIKSACSCPCQSEGGEVVPGQEGVCPADQSEKECTNLDENEMHESACSGVNDYCQRDENKPVCSGHGICICAVCICNILPPHGNPESILSANASQALHTQRYRGWYCQCDDFNCPWSHGALCGGPSRGTCVCGTCRCTESYRGDACQATTAMENCVDASGSVCSNHGQCANGVCVCEENFNGAMCEVCRSCPSTCSMYQQCIDCLIFPQHRTSPNCDAQCAASHPNTTFTAVTDEWPESAQVCTLEAHGCFHEYAYTSPMNATVPVYYRPTPNCHDEIDFL